MSWFDRLRGKAVQPIVHEKLVIASRENLDDTDLADDVAVDTQTPIAGLAIVVSYTGANGKKSERLITCRRYDVHGNLRYISAYCHTRKSVRLFRIDRISEVFDHRTGESLNPVEEFFSQFDVSRVHTSAYGWGLSVKVRADLIAYLNSLMFLARCDRKYHSLEREVLDELICQFWLRMELTGEPDCASIVDYADRLAPDAETFWIALNRVKEHPVLSGIFRRAAQAIIFADGEIRDEERYWGGEIDKFFAPVS